VVDFVLGGAERKRETSQVVLLSLLFAYPPGGVVEASLLTPHLADGTQHEPERDAGPEPAVVEDVASALEVEHVSAVQLRAERRGQARGRYKLVTLI